MVGSHRSRKSRSYASENGLGHGYPLEYGQRNASVVDPFGHRWMLAGPLLGEL
jgi:hypothetical protein